jgi:hypothetical protein
VPEKAAGYWLIFGVTSSHCAFGLCPSYSRQRGGTNNPFKKLKPDPNKPGNVLETDSNGKTTSKPAPEGFKEWWDTKHPDKPFNDGKK